MVRYTAHITVQTKKCYAFFTKVIIIQEIVKLCANLEKKHEVGLLVRSRNIELGVFVVVFYISDFFEITEKLSYVE